MAPLDLFGSSKRSPGARVSFNKAAEAKDDQQHGTASSKSSFKVRRCCRAALLPATLRRRGPAHAPLPPPGRPAAKTAAPAAMHAMQRLLRKVISFKGAAHGGAAGLLLLQ